MEHKTKLLRTVKLFMTKKLRKEPVIQAEIFSLRGSLNFACKRSIVDWSDFFFNCFVFKALYESTGLHKTST